MRFLLNLQLIRLNVPKVRDFSPRSTNNVYLRNCCIQGRKGEVSWLSISFTAIPLEPRHLFERGILILCKQQVNFIDERGILILCKQQVNFIDETNIKFRVRFVSMVNFLKEINSFLQKWAWARPPNYLHLVIENST